MCFGPSTWLAVVTAPVGWRRAIAAFLFFCDARNELRAGSVRDASEHRAERGVNLE